MADTALFSVRSPGARIAIISLNLFSAKGVSATLGMTPPSLPALHSDTPATFVRTVTYRSFAALGAGSWAWAVCPSDSGGSLGYE